MKKLEKDFKEFIELLNSNDVQYIIVGAYSMAAYGYVRATGDIDIWVNNTTDNINKLVDALNKFGFSFDENLQNELIQYNKRLVLGNQPLQIDIMTTIEGVDFKKAYKKRSVLNYEDIKLSMISLEDLITNKRSTGRLKDKADVEELEKK